VGVPQGVEGGPAATAAYFAEAHWELDVARDFAGALHYQDTAAMRGDGSYDGWDCTGAYALAFALPLKKIVLTGKRPSVVEPLVGEALRETIDAGRDFSYWTEKNPYADRPTAALLAGLASWSPAVRTRSAAALATREGDITDSLLGMLAGNDRFARYGALEALARRGKKSDPAENTFAGCSRPTTLGCGSSPHRRSRNSAPKSARSRYPLFSSPPPTGSRSTRVGASRPRSGRRCSRPGPARVVRRPS
jgi:hypothetical protein